VGLQPLITFYNFNQINYKVQIKWHKAIIKKKLSWWNSSDFLFIYDRSERSIEIFGRFTTLKIIWPSELWHHIVVYDYRCFWGIYCFHLQYLSHLTPHIKAICLYTAWFPTYISVTWCHTVRHFDVFKKLTVEIWGAQDGDFWGMLSYGMWIHVVWWKFVDISAEYIAFIYRAKD
jgi:hypothetical protein